MPRSPIAIALLLVLLSSCIHERREMCPSYITLDLSETPDAVEKIFIVLQYDDGREKRDTISKDMFSSGCELPIPRGSASIAVYGNIETMVYDNGYTAPKGAPLDRIYAYFSRIEAYSDLCSAKVSVEKKHISLYIKVLDEPNNISQICLELSGSTVGYTNRGNSIKGEFYHSPAPENIPSTEEPFVIFSSRIPQIERGDNFRLTITDSDDGYTLAAIPLSEKLEEAGIGAPGEELGDLYMTIDMSRGIIRLSVKDFDVMPHEEITF